MIFQFQHFNQEVETMHRRVAFRDRQSGGKKNNLKKPDYSVQTSSKFNSRDVKLNIRSFRNKMIYDFCCKKCITWTYENKQKRNGSSGLKAVEYVKLTIGGKCYSVRNDLYIKEKTRMHDIVEGTHEQRYSKTCHSLKINKSNYVNPHNKHSFVLWHIDKTSTLIEILWAIFRNFCWALFITFFAHFLYSLGILSIPTIFKLTLKY